MQRTCTSSLLAARSIIESSKTLALLQLRSFSDDKGDGSTAAEPPAEAPAGGAGAAQDAPSGSSTANEPAGPTLADLVARGYTKRQAAHILPDPEKHKHFLPRLSRREVGGYNDPAALEQFGQEVELYPQVPSDKPIYNLREAVPEIAQPRSALFDRLKAAQAANPATSLRDLAATVGIVLPEEEPAPAPGMERILEWNMRLVLSPGIVGEPHPVNKKARCRVHLRALQRQCGLTDEALQHIALVAGPRYDPKTGYLSLTSERHHVREENRRHIVRMLSDLVQEGRRAFPAAAAAGQGMAQQAPSA